MRRKDKKARAKRRSQQYATEKVFAALVDFRPDDRRWVLRHGKDKTFMSFHERVEEQK